MLKHDFEDADGLLKWHPTGSNYICDPPVLDTDVDFILLVDYEVLTSLEKLGYFNTSEDTMEDYPDDDGFTTYRRANVNLIVIEDAVIYGRLVTATEIAKRLNLTDKQERIDLFQGVLYGNYRTC
jgi:hypothetical protein